MASKQRISEQLKSVEKAEQLIAIKKNTLLQKAITSQNPSDILTAQTVLNNIEDKNEIKHKSYIIDPNDFNSFLGYKNKTYSLSYNMSRRISYSVPIIRAIIGTRIDQVASFCEPQSDKYSTGFIIRKKKKYFETATESQPTKEDQAKIQRYTEFILNCGEGSNFQFDDFDTFVRKFINDCLTYDQGTFEVVRNRRGVPVSFFATDSSTMRITDNIDGSYFAESLGSNSEKFYNRKKVKGYLPSHCQLKDGYLVADYYPWELCFGIRNPTTNIYSNGYGVSEIEVLMNTITSMLWGDEYNRRFFSQGSAPKGFIKIKSGANINNGKVSEFKQQWQSMMSGVYNSWKTPVLEGDIDWVDLQHNNRDMEFSNWQEYLIKISCGIYRIDPAEINFPLSGSSDQKPMFEGNNEARLKHSKDKGLYPLLKFLQRKLNKYIMQQIDPEFELVFCGMDGVNIGDELDNDIKMVSNFMTIDEVRIRRGLKPLGDDKGGSIICNSIWLQNKNAEEQAKQAEEQQQQQGMEGQEQEGEPEYEEQELPEEDPFEKALSTYMKTLQ